MPDTPDPIRAACEAAAQQIDDAAGVALRAFLGEKPPPETPRIDSVDDLAAVIESHLRGPLTDRERAALRMLRTVYREIGNKSDIFKADDDGRAPYRGDAHISDLTLTADECRDIRTIIATYDTP